MGARSQRRDGQGGPTHLHADEGEDEEDEEEEREGVDEGMQREAEHLEDPPHFARVSLNRRERLKEAKEAKDAQDLCGQVGGASGSAHGHGRVGEVDWGGVAAQQRAPGH